MVERVERDDERKGRMMRLTPIENPRHPMTRLAYRMFRRQFGKVATPLKVIYARMPGILPQLMMINRTAEKSVSLEPELKLLVFNFVDTLNGCTFCDDYRRAIAVQRRMGMEKFAAMSDYRTSDAFTGRERAAMAYAEEATRREVSDETFRELQRRFTDTEIVELTWLIAVENYFNLLKQPLQIESDGLRELAEQRIERQMVKAA
jgi:alkylhydroperoxidase family enzyme